MPYNIGDRVEYWSDTYRQWMPGTVQRVRDGGLSFDLDVKKGAQASKLRPDRSAALAQARGPSAFSFAVREPLSWTDDAPTELQARQIHAELTQVTRAIQGQVDWAEMSGQDMVSRAGAVTVRKMVETTKALLQGLEGALILRAGFIASCFHMWRCETTLSRAGRGYQDEFHRHHNEWGSYVEQIKRHYEGELQRLQMIAMNRKDANSKQQMVILEKWLHGDKMGLKREVWRCWRDYSKTQKGAKKKAESVKIMINEWAEGRNRGILHTCYRDWRELAMREMQARLHQDDQARWAKGMQEQMDALQAQKDAELHNQLRELERRHKDKTSNMEVVLAKWERGSKQGLLTATMQAWKTRAQLQKAKGPIEMQVRKWEMGSARGLLSCTWTAWKHDAIHSSHERKHLSAEEEKKQLQKMLADAEKAKKDLEQKHMSEHERKLSEAKAVTECILKKWEMGSKKGLLKEAVQLWTQCTKQAKSLGRKRQAVHDAILRSLEGDAKAAKHISFLNWRELTKSEKLVREVEAKEAASDAKIHKFLAESQAEHDAKIAELENSVAAVRGRAHEAAQSTVKKWILGDRKGLMSAALTSWHTYVVSSADRERKRNAVKDALVRSIEGDKRGIMRMTLIEWQAFVKLEHTRHEGNSAKDTKIDELEKKLEAMINKEARKMTKYAEVLGGKQEGVLKKMVFASWKAQCGGLATELEKERENAVAMQEMERQRHLAETMHREQRLRVLNAMGCKRDAIIKGMYFEAWSYLWQQVQEKKAQKLNKNKAMLQYSEFVIGQKLKKDRGTMLASTFSEWHREAKILQHQNHHEAAQNQILDMRQIVAKLEAQNRDLQEQLGIYYQQIDHITNTLQKELKTKEELAAELQHAYRMRRGNTPAMPSFPEQSALAWSRTSSEQTLHDHPVTPGGPPLSSARDVHAAAAPLPQEPVARGVSSAAPVAGLTPRRERAFSPLAPAPPPDLAPPGVPQVSFSSRNTRGVSREVEAGLTQAYVEASLQDDGSDVNGRRSRESSRARGPGQADAVFRAIDRNNDGVITPAEFREAYKIAGRS